MDAISFTPNDFHVLKPAIALCVFGCGILLTDVFLVRRTGMRWLNAITALVGEGIVTIALLQHLADVRSGGAFSGLSGSILIDGFGVFFNLIFVMAATLAVILSARYMESEGEHRGSITPCCCSPRQACRSWRPATTSWCCSSRSRPWR